MMIINNNNKKKKQKKIKECYTIIDNFLYYCMCDSYLGCQTQMNFVTNTKTYCYICLFSWHFNAGMLHKVKNNTEQLRALYDEILKVCCDALKSGCTNFWDQDFYYSMTNLKEGRVLICSLNNDIYFLFGL